MSAPGSGFATRSLQTDAQFLKGVGPRLAPLLAKAGLRTVYDVLLHLPRRYEDRTNLPPIRNLRPGQFATIRGTVSDFEGRSARRGGVVVLKALVGDATGTATLVWFNQPWITKRLAGYDGEIIAYGLVKEGTYGCEIHSPEFELLGDDDDPDAFAKIVPVYPLVEGLQQFVVRRAVDAALEGYLGFVEDPLPEEFRRRHKLQKLQWAIRQVHHPESEEFRLKARKRLVFDEFFHHQVGLAMRRAETQLERGIAFGLADVPDLKAQVHQMFPFELTGAQSRVVEEIWSDMASPHPMNRLVQGDVGSGKTAVAAAALLAAIRCGFQGALMAPTEILAEQHCAHLHRLLDPLGVRTALLVGKQTPTQKKKAAAAVAKGEADLAIGTHALIQEGVEFQRLGLVVIDEQHRFGVLQRLALREKALGNPDVLVMTATPIPRTLTMTLYGDLELSVIDEMPPGRQPIKTWWKLPHERPSVYDAVRKLVSEGRQAYIVCPMVSEGEKMLAQAAEELYARLSQKEFPDLRVGLLHGQLKVSEKEAAMDRFRAGEIDVLVSTTVIEVGVDVPNATIMVVEDANRFGLSQLHQLRGRVGRGSEQSFCVLVADAKTDDARERMDALVGTSDGFKIAETDLRLRGPGEIAGTRQSGNLDFKIADLVQDGVLLEAARQAAMELIAEDPGLKRPEHAKIRERALRQPGEVAVIASS
ncbi:MAG: ATP-dependent DNA helicase RecG [Fimbriimonadaceae bacterium]|nr:ATP-dependent DNA helicase RecG [Fimbriimonadaceae bacterium]